MRIFRRMAEEEGGIHGMPAEAVHLHELGAVDTIVDVTGALLALDRLGIERVVVSPVPLGRGLARGSHGIFPLPAPATVALLRKAPVVGVNHPVETVTPTAAALLTEAAARSQALAALGRRTTVRPGWLSRVLGGSLSLLPRPLRVRLLARIMHGMVDAHAARASVADVDR